MAQLDSLDEQILAKEQLANLKQKQKKTQAEAEIEEITELERMYSLPSPEDDESSIRNQVGQPVRPLSPNEKNQQSPRRRTRPNQIPPGTAPVVPTAKPQEEEEEPEVCSRCGSPLGVLGQCTTCGKLPVDCTCKNQRQNDEEGEEQKAEEDQAEADETAQDEIQRQKLAEVQQQAILQQQLQGDEAEGPVSAIKKVQTATKWWKRIVWISEFIAATWPVWGTILVICIFVAGCNSSTVFRVLSLGVCEAVIIPGINTTGEVVLTAQSSAGDAANRDFLAKHGITVNKQCIDQNQRVPNPPGQTCLGGMSYAALDEIVKITRACDGSGSAVSNSCGVIVTGGTELGHESGRCSHESGNKFDIDDTPALNKYITTHFTPAGTRKDGAILYQSSAGVMYARESNHWDVGGVGCT